MGDSVSQISFRDCRPKSKHGSITSCRSAGAECSSLSSVHMREKAEHAALVARAAALERKQALDLQEAQFKAKREQLAVETALAESSARLKLLEVYEDEQSGMNSYVSKRLSRVKVEGKRGLSTNTFLHSKKGYLKAIIYAIAGLRQSTYTKASESNTKCKT